MSRIDRVVVNGCWLDLFPESEAIAHVPGISDHCSFLVTIFEKARCRKPFRFYNFWMKNHQFKALVINSWVQPQSGSAMLSFSLKLKRLKPVLRNLNSQWDDSIRDLEKDVVRTYMELSAAEESFKKQKSRVNWLVLGDNNTKFFHHKVSSHRVRNLSLIIADGIWLDKPADVQHEDARASLQQIIRRKVPTHMKEDQVKPILIDEVRATLNSIKGDKAPGPDGFCSSFFQQNWDIVGQDLVAAVMLFFEKEYILREWNSTALTLVPKIPNPSMAKDYKPIACCNVVYKVITKIIANRMQQTLPLVISQTQFAFIKGRSIVDNVLLMHELIRNYHRDAGPPRCAIKIDIMKPFDSVDWDFLLDTMVAMGFPHIFVGWIRACVTTPMFSIMMNGGLVGYFPGARGLRQGHPISPYLFLIVLEAFSSLLQFNIETESLRIIMNTLKEFHSYSGLQPNMMKSACYFSGVPTALKLSLIDLMVITEIEGVLGAFLWSGLDMKHTGAKVSWMHLCVPKNEGGLGFMSLKEWNQASNIRHLWALSFKAASLWVKWVHMYILKGHSLWEIPIPNDASWVIRKLLKLRDICQGWIRYCIGDGEDTFLWTDNWHPLGALYKQFGDSIVINRGRALRAKVLHYCSGKLAVAKTEESSYDGATSYFLWGERKMRIFQNKSRDVDDLAAAILDAIRAKLCSFNSVKFSCLNRQICDDWEGCGAMFRSVNWFSHGKPMPLDLASL
ncbi:uncharacterized protein LOC131323761 [Rhododendron vialii]|uniref:uncharacterized protein LOC131323761 n=1 Tax=Rhododendron vialii TaxID=182163 RepID=UPI00265D7CB1|nr:uncharacterized protein LOC131323761 [Rhododendron vialii]